MTRLADLPVMAKGLYGSLPSSLTSKQWHEYGRWFMHICLLDSPVALDKTSGICTSNFLHHSHRVFMEQVNCHTWDF